MHLIMLLRAVRGFPREIYSTVLSGIFPGEIHSYWVIDLDHMASSAAAIKVT